MLLHLGLENHHWIQAYSKLCKVVFELGNMRKKALNSHAKGKEHSKKVQDLKLKSKTLLPVKLNLKLII